MNGDNIIVGDVLQNFVDCQSCLIHRWMEAVSFQRLLISWIEFPINRLQVIYVDADIWNY